MKTLHPLILTAQILPDDLQPFDLLRRAHFPPARNFLRAHLTMFYRLPGEHGGPIIQHLTDAAAATGMINAEVSGVRHIGAGVAFTIASGELETIRTGLKSVFAPYLVSQDMQKWQPHITVQNKVSRSIADRLYKDLLESFQPHRITITGLDLWRYLHGPWKHEFAAPFMTGP